ncbi:MAG: flagellar basal-body rod protein FlgF [Alphaproteobacteria bacterium]|nr:MAG: flagellar basal-body rod protein FlgF [Alphaproteobacteria bacterium]
MENASLVGLSRQMALQRELDVVSNNIANLNTTGFKADNVVFQEFLMPGARANQFTGGDRQLSFVQDRATWLDLSQGPVERTGNPLDVAVSGNAFLTVQTPRGERYTRNGALQINAQGQLVTSEGLQVIGQNGPIVFQPNDRDISIGSDGLISVREGQNTTDSQRGKLKLASFDQPQRLQKDGTSTYMAPAGVTPNVPAEARVTQGAVEKSNVKSVMEMTRMVEVTRTYTQIASMLQSQSDTRKSAIDKLAEVPTN